MDILLKKKKRETRRDAMTRIEVRLQKPNRRKYTEIDFEDLCGNLNIVDKFLVDENDSDADFENDEDVEVSSTSSKAHRSLMNRNSGEIVPQNLMQKGTGYDREDPFVDDSDVVEFLLQTPNNAVRTNDRTTRYGGYFVHCGVENELISNEIDEIQPEHEETPQTKEPKKRGRRKAEAKTTEKTNDDNVDKTTTTVTQNAVASTPQRRQKRKIAVESQPQTKRMVGRAPTSKLVRTEILESPVKSPPVLSQPTTSFSVPISLTAPTQTTALISTQIAPLETPKQPVISTPMTSTTHVSNQLSEFTAPKLSPSVAIKKVSGRLKPQTPQFSAVQPQPTVPANPLVIPEQPKPAKSAVSPSTGTMANPKSNALPTLFQSPQSLSSKPTTSQPSVLLQNSIAQKLAASIMNSSSIVSVATTIPNSKPNPTATISQFTQQSTIRNSMNSPQNPKVPLNNSISSVPSLMKTSSGSSNSSPIPKQISLSTVASTKTTPTSSQLLMGLTAQQQAQLAATIASLPPIEAQRVCSVFLTQLNTVNQLPLKAHNQQTNLKNQQSKPQVQQSKVPKALPTVNPNQEVPKPVIKSNLPPKPTVTTSAYVPSVNRSNLMKTVTSNPVVQPRVPFNGSIVRSISNPVIRKTTPSVPASTVPIINQPKLSAAPIQTTMPLNASFLNAKTNVSLAVKSTSTSTITSAASTSLQQSTSEAGAQSYEQQLHAYLIATQQQLSMASINQLTLQQQSALRLAMPQFEAYQQLLHQQHTATQSQVANRKSTLANRNVK
ncbi:hypothetical protein M3Y96_01003800 [Aphelenchoides besseyi]|nr:hypothetical protein M3Y96_01003800 [Aphelenchoides besseyi]